MMLFISMVIEQQYYLMIYYKIALELAVNKSLRVFIFAYACSMISKEKIGYV